MLVAFSPEARCDMRPETIGKKHLERFEETKQDALLSSERLILSAGLFYRVLRSTLHYHEQNARNNPMPQSKAGKKLTFTDEEKKFEALLPRGMRIS